MGCDGWITDLTSVPFAEFHCDICSKPITAPPSTQHIACVAEAESRGLLGLPYSYEVIVEAIPR